MWTPRVRLETTQAVVTPRTARSGWKRGAPLPQWKCKSSQTENAYTVWARMDVFRNLTSWILVTVKELDAWVSSLLRKSEVQSVSAACVGKDGSLNWAR